MYGIKTGKGFPVDYITQHEHTYRFLHAKRVAGLYLKGRVSMRSSTTILKK
jgi:hypothetical protein